MTGTQSISEILATIENNRLKDALAVLRLPIKKITLIKTPKAIFTIDTFNDADLRLIYSQGFLDMIVKGDS